jgi:hypothetical protein
LTKRLLGACVVLAIALVACGRTSATNGGATQGAVFAGSVRLSDVAPSLGDSTNWWPGPPQFGARPLDSSTRSEEERFELTVRYAHTGTAETLNVVYRVWISSALATAIMTGTQQAVGASLKGPKAGDQILYYNRNLSFGAAPYESETLVRVGQVVVQIVWSRTLSFASLSDQGSVANKVVSRLKDGLAGKLTVESKPAPDPKLLPPPGPDLTLLGTDRLPVETVAQMVGAPAPADVAAVFRQLGATDFVYGDYALNNDTHMEVQTSAFTFSSPTGATDWLDRFVGKSALDSSGGYFNYDDPTGQYIAAFGVGSKGVVMICRSAAQLEAASRACELPMSRVAGAWKTALGG